ncbi:hypothetical protein KKB18_08195 [bacterium]|nr:hypothetical protein [bacterium]
MKESSADKTKLIQLMNDYLKNNKLSCSDAFTINEATGIPLKDIGKMADDMDIKICECQLGCFK